MKTNTVRRAILEALSNQTGYPIQNIERELEGMMTEAADAFIEDVYHHNVDNRCEDIELDLNDLKAEVEKLKKTA